MPSYKYNHPFLKLKVQWTLSRVTSPTLNSMFCHTQRCEREGAGRRCSSIAVALAVGFRRLCVWCSAVQSRRPREQCSKVASFRSGHYRRDFPFVHLCLWLRAGSRKKHKIPPSGNKERNALNFSTLKIKISTRPHEQGEHSGKNIWGVRVVARELWTLFALRVEALFRTW